MCKVYNQIGSLTTIKSNLLKHNVNNYKSVRELINFQKSYSIVRQQIISDHRFLIEQERRTLGDVILQLEHDIRAEKYAIEKQLQLELEELKHRLASLPSTHPNVIKALSNYINKNGLKQKIKNNKSTFDFKIANAVKYLIEEYDKKNSRNQYIVSNFEDAVIESCLPQLQELDRKKQVIDQLNSTIYGALGEQKVVRELEKLADDYILINDFRCEFRPAIYNRQENDYIKSVQIDHILLSPSGIFLIETKNWSQHSLNDTRLYSPVQQIKRTNFALYKIVNGVEAPLIKHHWGNRKIPIRNLIVIINYKPIEEFPHVKILTLNDLLSYINYFKPCFSINETQIIANHLLYF